jgi:uncharacterized protein YbjT (DUF2867 family)
MVRDPRKADLRLGDVSARIELVRADVTQPETLPAALRGASAVVHLVAVAIEKGDATYERINHEGTVNVVEAARAAGVRRFVNMSQNGADSAAPYRFLRSKGLAQDYVAASELAWTAFRPSSIFGPRDEFFNALARMVRLTPLCFPLVGGGEAEFQPLYVHDVAEAVVRSLDDDTTIGRELALGGPEVRTMGEIARRILRAMDASRLLVPAPTWLLRLPVLIMERALPGSPVPSELLDLLAVRNVIDRNALVEHFGITPRAFDGENIAYLRENTVKTAIDRIVRGKVES